MEKKQYENVNLSIEFFNDQDAILASCIQRYEDLTLLFSLINNDTEYEVSGCSVGPDDLVIPATYKGKPVTSIGASAFKNCKSLTSVVIGESVTSIGDGAFENCKSLTSVVIGDSVTSIGDGAFYNCSSLTSVVIGDSVTSIGYDAFYSCDSLTSIEIPDSVTRIGPGAFRDCGSLQYNVKDGLKYLGNSTNKYLYLVGEGEKVTSIATAIIDSNCRFIGNDAFNSCDSLTSVVIGESVTSIGSFAFSCCGSLTSVVIGESVTSIDDGAFYNCSSLTSVYYGGTAEDWQGINTGAYFNDGLQNATRYYYIENEADLPNDDGNYWHYVDGVPTIWVCNLEE